MWVVYGIMFLVVVVIAVFWVKGITDTHEKHSDYKGDDLFGEEDKEKKIIKYTKGHSTRHKAKEWPIKK
jgi:hypothetical protein